MKKLYYYKEIFENNLHTESFISDPIKLYEPIQYSLSLPAKRLRPVLCLLCSDMYGGDISKSIPAAVAIEIFHNFTLVHDDIMDNSPLRRGMPTVYKKWDTNIAILSGDVMFAKAYEYVAKIDVPNLKPILDIFTQTAIKVCEGQQYDVDYEKMNNITIKDYFKMIELKTAVLIGAAMQIGSIIASVSEAQAKLMYDIGVKMGLVFQLQDDLLDMFSDESVFGKKIGTDIIAGKKTILFLKTLELLSHGEREEFYVYYTGQHHNADEKIEYVKKVYEKLDIKKHVVSLMNELHQEFLHLLNQSEGSKEQLNVLTDFAETLLVREL